MDYNPLICIFEIQKQTLNMTKLSVNINKLATLRNARGGNMPNLLTTTADIERFGAQGITIHPRPDERHIRYQDARELKNIVTTEYNIEGNPNKKFIDLVLEVKPTQVTLVPDAVNAITSNAGWDAITHQDYLKNIITTFKNAGIRTSIFIDPVEAQIKAAAATGTHRIELYTEAYAKGFLKGAQEKAVAPYIVSARMAKTLGLGVNAGHDLSLDNMAYFKAAIPELEEVSIGHALICEALYMGLENVIPLYLKALS